MDGNNLLTVVISAVVTLLGAGGATKMYLAWRKSRNLDADYFRKRASDLERKIAADDERRDQTEQAEKVKLLDRLGKLEDERDRLKEKFTALIVEVAELKTENEYKSGEIVRLTQERDECRNRVSHKRGQ